MHRDIKGNIILAISLFTFSSNVFAYLDPGTGSVFVQAIISVISLGMGAIVFYWQKLLNFFKKKKNASDPTSTEGLNHNDE